MPTTQVLDTEKLLAPISAEQPTGANVHGTEDQDRYNAVSRIRMRYFSNAKSWQQRYRTSCLRGTPRPAQDENASWLTVVNHATTCLTSQSKDLWATAYLLVGLTYVHGFAGLHQGVSFLSELLQRFGAQLHPAAQPLAELRKTIPDIEDALQFAALTGSDHGSRCRLDFVIAADIATFTPEQLEPYRTLGAPLKEQLQSELSESAAEQLNLVAETIKSCKASLDTLDQQIRAQFPSLPNRDEYPIYDGVRKELSACLALIEPHLRPVSQAASSQGTEVATDGPSPPITAGDVPQSRQTALRQLEEIAAFFERIEPLSPLPFVIRRAVAWGNMSLPEVLAELLSEDERKKLMERAGIPMHQNPSSS
jgi:type VI secretion system protein ImpA